MAEGGGEKHFTDAKSGGEKRITFVRRKLRQAGRGAHLANGQIGFRQPCIIGRDLASARVVHRTSHPFASSGAADGRGRAFATVGQGDDLEFGCRPGALQASRDTLPDFLRA